MASKARCADRVGARGEVDGADEADGADVEHVRQLLQAEWIASAQTGSRVLARSNSFSSR